jgi:hypothetical protein
LEIVGDDCTRVTRTSAPIGGLTEALEDTTWRMLAWERTVPGGRPACTLEDNGTN